MSITIPLCYYPTQQLLLDDDQRFSNSIALKLNSPSTLIFSSPKQALDYLDLETSKSTFKAQLFNDAEANDSSAENTTYSLQLNLAALNALVFQDPRSQETSVIFVDYHMPSMTGIEFLQKIEQCPAQKILLTGEQDYRIAINAFNKGLIHTYIRKDDETFIDKLQTVIVEAQWQYFLNLSSLIIQTPNSDFRYLKDAELSTVFKEILKAHKIVAFALCNLLGDFKLMDTAGNIKYFITRSKSQLNALAQVAREDQATEQSLVQLEASEVIPFFGEMQNFWDVPANTWQDYLFPANKLSNSSDIVWAFIDSQIP